MGKWGQFHQAHSNVVKAKPKPKPKENISFRSVSQDWYRASTSDTMTVNGHSIKKYAPLFNSFSEEKDVEDFFTKVILKNMKDDSKKDQAVEYLKQTFHQTGLLYPVSDAIIDLFKNKEGNLYAVIDMEKRESEVNIISTESGFKIQEFVKLKGIEIIDPAEHEALGIEGETEIGRATISSSDSGYLIKAQATVAVDFSKNAQNPTIEIESDRINIDHEQLRNKLGHDKRDFKQIVVDFFRSLVGMNNVKEISPETITPLLSRASTNETFSSEPAEDSSSPGP